VGVLQPYENRKLQGNPKKNKTSPQVALKQLHLGEGTTNNLISSADIPLLPERFEHWKRT